MRYTFSDYELDTRRCELRRDGEPCRVEPQVFDVLAYLLQHHDRVVTRQELTGQVWGHTFITTSTLSSRLMAARRAVGDDGRVQRVIKTLHGRGYRFIAPVRVADAEHRRDAAPADAFTAPPADEADSIFVGREVELRFLDELLDTALRGARRIVFLTGEAGIGRTALVEEFLDRVRARGGIGVACGQCVDQHGPGEAYMPVLHALGRLCLEPAHAELVPLLDRLAPTWLAQLPALLSADELRALQGRISATTRERMLREMVEALEAWSATRPLVLVLEDLHWSDPSTLHLLDFLARRREAARLLIVGTCRATASAGGGALLRALVDELSVHGLCTELVLHPLTESATHAYLVRRCQRAELPAGLSPLVHQRAEGNPLFMGALVDDWVRRGVLCLAEGEWRLRDTPDALTAEIPLTLRRLIGQQIGQHSPAQGDLLEAASVAGLEFSSGVVAAGLGQEVEEVEERCERLIREGGLLQAREPEPGPGGMLAGRYAFAHHLYREVLYDRIPPGRRLRLHRQIGTHLEAAFGPMAPQRAGELAVHFVRGGDPARAIHYLHRAAEQCTARGAYPEAAAHLEQALQLLREHPDLPEGEAPRLELAVLRTLGPTLLTMRGWGDEEAERAFSRARALAEQLDDRSQLGAVLYGMATMHEIRGEYETSQALVERCLRLELPAHELRVESHELLACSLFHQGLFTGAIEQAERGLHFFDPEQHRSLTASHGGNPGISCHYWAGLALWFLGDPEQALARIRLALRLAGGTGNSAHRISPEIYAARLHQHRREPALALEHADSARALARRHGFSFHYSLATILRGWARAAMGEVEPGIDEVREGLDAHGAVGAAIVRPYCLGLLAEVLGWAGRHGEAIAALDDALAMVGRHSRSFFWEAELHRLRGEILLHDPTRGCEAEECFRRALDISRRQGARALEVRASGALTGGPHPAA